MKNIYLFLFLFIGCTAYANSINTANKNSDGISAKTEGMKKQEGFFNYYYDSKTDKVFLEIDKLDQEFLYVQSLAAGIGSNDIGLDRNQMGRERVVKFIRRGPKILMLQPNYSYLAKSDNEDERKSVEDAFAQSVLWGFRVEAEDKNKVLIDLSDFLMDDAHNVSGRLKSNGEGSYSVNNSMSAMYLERTKNFPKNSEFEVTLTFTGKATGKYLPTVAPTNSNITVRQHHSFVELPDDNYETRKFDPRAGFWELSYFDYATPISEDIHQRLITRHRLKKKNPEAEVSEAVEPIIYYMDRGTPEPVRSALMEGASWWNQAFEAAGYKDAFQVKLLPEGADPMDVRYNMINWVHRSTRGWSYGGGVTDPRTGEIIKGHVLLGSLRVRQDYLIAEGLLAPYLEGQPVSDEMEKMALARLRQLAAHEVGHTLGISHSYTSSAEGRASVMDYPHPLIKIKDGKIDLSDAYDDGIGAWDKVSVAYGYQDFPDGANEDAELEKIIQQSLKSGLTFLTDQDARPHGSAHPYAHLWDNGKSPEEELLHLLEVRKIALSNFGENNIKMGEPYANLEEVLVPIYFLHRYQVEAAVKLIGGLNYRYAQRGDGQFITEFVLAEKQKAALNALIKSTSAEVLTLPESIIKMIPPRPNGYYRGRELVDLRTNLTFDPIAAAETSASMTFNLLFNTARAQRLVEYHSRDKSQPSLEFVLNEVISKTWKTKNTNALDGEVSRAVEQVLLTKLFELHAHKSTSEQVKAIVRQALFELNKYLTANADAQSFEQKAHFYRGFTRIKNFWENPKEYETEGELTPPDGSPIGMDKMCK